MSGSVRAPCMFRLASPINGIFANGAGVQLWRVRAWGRGVALHSTGPGALHLGRPQPHLLRARQGLGIGGAG